MAARRSPFEGLVALYADHKSSPLSAVGELHRLESLVQEEPPGEGVVVLATCNRFEVYVHRPDPERLERLASEMRAAGARPGTVEGRRAVLRIMRIASGLESAVLGENEILGQVREAWLRYRERGLTTRLLDRVFHAAILAGKRVRSETGISRGPASYYTAAVQAAAERIGGLDGAIVAVVGGGESGRKLAGLICSLYRPARLYAVSRSAERARSVASRCEAGVPVLLGEARGLDGLDAVFVAVKGYQRSDLEWALRARVVVDISNPPAVPRAGGRVVTIEELSGIVRSSIEERRRWVPAAEEIILEELSKLEARLLEAQYRVGDIIGRLERRAEELARSLARSEEEYRVLRLYGKKLLHPVYVALRRAAASGMSWEAFQEAVSNGAGSVRGVPKGEA